MSYTPIDQQMGRAVQLSIERLFCGRWKWELVSTYCRIANRFCHSPPFSLLCWLQIAFRLERAVVGPSCSQKVPIATWNSLVYSSQMQRQKNHHLISCCCLRAQVASINRRLSNLSSNYSEDVCRGKDLREPQMLYRFFSLLRLKHELNLI